MRGVILSARAWDKMSRHLILCDDINCSYHMQSVQGPGYGILYSRCGWFYWAPQP